MNKQWKVGLVATAVLAVMMLGALLHDAKTLPQHVAKLSEQNNVQEIGLLLYGRNTGYYMFPFEIASLLLVGGGCRRRGNGEAEGVRMLEIGIVHYLVVAAMLFLIGMVGVITRRNVMIIFMSIELMLSSVNLNLVAFSRLYGLHGQVFALFIAADAAAEAAVGLGILIAFFRNRATVNMDEVDLLKW